MSFPQLFLIRPGLESCAPVLYLLPIASGLESCVLMGCHGMTSYLKSLVINHYQSKGVYFFNAGRKILLGSNFY